MVMNIFNILYPQRCIFCGKIDSSICHECSKNVYKISGRICEKCGRPIGDVIYSMCKNCLSNDYHFDKIFSVYLYKGAARRGILLFKYKGFFQFAEKFSEEIIEKVSIIKNNIDLVVPVPIHKNRYLDRGYNQSLLLAHQISKRLLIPYCDILIRKIETKPFYNISFKERQREIRGKIDVKKRYINTILNKNILLIDDIFTSGATMNECALVLKKHGACYVYGAVIAIAQYD